MNPNVNLGIFSVKFVYVNWYKFARLRPYIFYTPSLNLASSTLTGTSVCVHPAYYTKQPSVLVCFAFQSKAPCTSMFLYPVCHAKAVICGQCFLHGSEMQTKKSDFLLKNRTEALEIKVDVAFAVFGNINLDICLIRKIPNSSSKSIQVQFHQGPRHNTSSYTLLYGHVQTHSLSHTY